MRSIRAGFSAGLPLLFATLATLSGCGSDESNADRRVVLLFTSDEHSHLFSFSPELDDHPHATKPGTGALKGGVARRAALLADERKAAVDAGKDTLTVSAGDNHMGGMPELRFRSGSVDYETMAALEYDVTTLGNHEFDVGPAALAEAIDNAKATGRIPIVASNIHFDADSPDDDALAAQYSADASDDAPIHPYRVITTAGGVKVGVLGWVGADAAFVAPNKAPVRFSAEALAPTQEGDAVAKAIALDLQPVVDRLRNQEKVDLVIGLSHGGIEDSSSEDAIKRGEDYRVAAAVKGIDVIVSGHAHNEDPKPIVVPSASGGRDTLVLNAGAFGKELGRVELVVHGNGAAPSWDEASQALLPVDDRIVPDPTQAEADDARVATIESGPTGAYLETLLSETLGEAVKDDPAVAGDLYFKPIASTDFDVTEPDMIMALSTDAMLAAADAWGAASGTITSVSIESAGVIRSSLAKGKTGVISAADAFAIVPLASRPEDGAIGSPLSRAYLSLLELRGIFELSLSFGATSGDFAIRPAGLRVEYDATRTPVVSTADLLSSEKGQVTRMLLDTDHHDGFEQFDTVIYDRAQMIGDPSALYAVVTSSYVAQFAAAVGVTLKDAQGNPLSLEQTVLMRSAQRDVTQIEAFFSYLASSPGKRLPARYDAASPEATRRFVCVNGC